MGSPKPIPEETPRGIPKELPDGIPESFTKIIPGIIPGGVHEDVAGNTLEGISWRTF